MCKVGKMWVLFTQEIEIYVCVNLKDAVIHIE